MAENRKMYCSLCGNIVGFSLLLNNFDVVSCAVLQDFSIFLFALEVLYFNFLCSVTG